MPSKRKSPYTLELLLIESASGVFRTNLYPKNQTFSLSLEPIFHAPRKISYTFPKNYRWLLDCKHEITHALETLYSSVDSKNDSIFEEWFF